MRAEQISKALLHLKNEARQMVSLSGDLINVILLSLADVAEERASEILEANQKDLDRMDPASPKYDRLLLNKERIHGIANDIRNVASLESPLHRIIESRKLENGLELKKITVPLGIIGIVYESRPNVTFDVFSLCFKSGNACVLKGSSDAHYSNICIVSLIQDVLRDHKAPDIIYLAPSSRDALPHILEADDIIDAIIPRGGQGLIDFVRAMARVPVIETGAGIVHTYIDASADLAKAKKIIRNAKTRRVSVCNALDTLIVHKDILAHLPDLLEGLDKEHQLHIHADAQSIGSVGSYDPKLISPVNKDSYGTEFLSMQMAIKTVSNLKEALDHIHRYSSKHSEAIVAEDTDVIESFLNSVDAAVVYANTSTAFTDGAQFGMGAEIGISTQKLHARGPMALRELTSYKWLVRGDGQVRP